MAYYVIRNKTGDFLSKAKTGWISYITFPFDNIFITDSLKKAKKTLRDHIEVDSILSMTIDEIQCDFTIKTTQTDLNLNAIKRQKELDVNYTKTLNEWIKTEKGSNYCGVFAFKTTRFNLNADKKQIEILLSKMGVSEYHTFNSHYMGGSRICLFVAIKNEDDAFQLKLSFDGNPEYIDIGEVRE